MAKSTIMDRLFHGKPDAKEVTVKVKTPVIRLATDRLFIGRTPGRFIDVKGQRSGDELSIKDSLDTLGANQAAATIFPLAATPGSYWLYFALFSTCKQTPGLRPLMQYIRFLKDRLGRNNAGVGHRVLNSKVRRGVRLRLFGIGGRTKIRTHPIFLFTPMGWRSDQTNSSSMMTRK